MNRAVSRGTYRLLVGLHPASFQDQFGGEMLWIFDEEYKRGNAGYLLLDGIISLLRQRCKVQNNPGQLSIASGAIITGPGIGPVRLLQAGVTFSVILFSLIVLAGRPNRFTVLVRWADRMPCYTVTLEAPSHAEVVLGTMP
jgi:hypothetical protein